MTSHVVRSLLVAISAQQRVARFLLEMSERPPEGEVIELPMSRLDVADYLGLSIETVVCEHISGLPSWRRVSTQAQAWRWS